MSMFRGWKEERIRHHIYLDQLKTAKNSSDRANLDGVHFEEGDGSSDLFLHCLPDNVRDRRTGTEKKRRGFSWMIVPLTILVVGAAAWFWVFHG